MPLDRERESGGLADSRREGKTTYVIPLNRLPTYSLHDIVDLIRAQLIRVRKHLLIQRPLVLHNPRHEFPHVALIRQQILRRPIAVDILNGNQGRVVGAAGWQSGKGDLVPEPDVDDGVGDLAAEDGVVDELLVVAQHHDSAGGADRREGAGDEAGDPGEGGGFDESELGELEFRVDGADEGVCAGEDGGEVWDGSFEIGDNDAKAAGSEGLDGRFVDGGGLDEDRDVEAAVREEAFEDGSSCFTRGS